MLLALLGGLTPTPLTHLVGNWSTLQPWASVFFPVNFVVFLAIGRIYDRISEGRIHPLSLWGGVAVFAWITAFKVAIIPTVHSRTPVLLVFRVTARPVDLHAIIERLRNAQEANRRNQGKDRDVPAQPLSGC